VNLLPITNRLEEQGVGTPGKDVFINFLPASVQLGILLRDYFGGTPTTPELPGYYKTSFMLIVRATSMESGQELLGNAIAALTVSSDTVMDEYLFKYIRARNLPFAYAPSPGQNIEIAINMDCCFIDVGA
jgi:hypothetical protein